MRSTKEQAIKHIAKETTQEVRDLLIGNSPQTKHDNPHRRQLKAVDSQTIDKRDKTADTLISKEINHHTRKDGGF